MTSRAPPIPPEQRSFRGQKADIEGNASDKSDRKAMNRTASASKTNNLQHYQQDR